MERFVGMTNSRENFLKEGQGYVEDLLGEQASYQVGLKYEKNLIDVIKSNENIISDNILSSSKLSKSIKAKIQSYSEDIRKIILATTAHAEKQKFQNVDEIIEAVRAGENEKRQIETLIQSYRKFSFSIETVKIAVDFFSIVNQSILDKLESVSRKSKDYPELMLKNAILVYEFTSFLIEFLNTSGITGTEDIKQIKEDLEEKFAYLESSYQKTEEILASEEIDPDNKQYALKDLVEKRKIIQLTREKWSTFENDLKKTKEESEIAINRLLPNLKLRQQLAKNQILTLEVVALVKAFEVNMQLADKLADVKKFELAPLTADDVRQLFGLEAEEEYKEIESSS